MLTMKLQALAAGVVLALAGVCAAAAPADRLAGKVAKPVDIIAGLVDGHAARRSGRVYSSVARQWARTSPTGAAGDALSKQGEGC